MQKQTLLWMFAILHLQALGQVPLNLLLPTATIGVAYGDTILNKSAILKREGIRTIIINLSSTRNTNGFSKITMQLSENGLVESTMSCINSSDKGKGFCLADTALYDANGLLKEFRFADAGGFTFMQREVDYSSKRVVKETWITRLPQKSAIDTNISYLYYNEKAQLIRLEHARKDFVFYDGTIFYNLDGLPDSIQHDLPSLGTYTFQRTQKKKKREIQLETTTSSHKWVFNAANQCISYEWSAKPRTNNGASKRSNSALNSEFVYYYNVDGTLSRVVENRNGKEFSTAYYSYIK